MRRRAAAAVAAAVAAAAVLGAGLAAAQSPQAEEKTEVKIIQEEDRTLYRKKTVIDFTDVAVEGDLTQPEGAYVLHRQRADFQSLIRVRDNFAPELQKSVDNL